MCKCTQILDGDVRKCQLYLWQADTLTSKLSLAEIADKIFHRNPIDLFYLSSQQHKARKIVAMPSSPKFMPLVP